MGRPDSSSADIVGHINFEAYNNQMDIGSWDQAFGGWQT